VPHPADTPNLRPPLRFADEDEEDEDEDEDDEDERTIYLHGKLHFSDDGAVDGRHGLVGVVRRRHLVA
jgi:hypothetical protein